MAGGFHSTFPVAIRVAFVAKVTSKLPSALQHKKRPVKQLFFIMYQPSLHYLSISKIKNGPRNNGKKIIFLQEGKFELLKRNSQGCEPL